MAVKPMVKKRTVKKVPIIYLIGMMGAGKTTIGHHVAQTLNYRFVDTDKLIEQTMNQPITEIFTQKGEASFRRLETQVLAQLQTSTQLVVATGGGIVTPLVNWTYLQHGFVVWLDVPVPVLASRLLDDTTRPLLRGAGNLVQTLEAVLTERRSLYERADLHVINDNDSVHETCGRIMTAIQETTQQELPTV